MSDDRLTRLQELADFTKRAIRQTAEARLFNDAVGEVSILALREQLERTAANIKRVVSDPNYSDHAAIELIRYAARIQALAVASVVIRDEESLKRQLINDFGKEFEEK